MIHGDKINQIKLNQWLHEKWEGEGLLSLCQNHEEISLILKNFGIILINKERLGVSHKQK
jgi:hypothetical protein